jgi:hypothetical protein
MRTAIKMPKMPGFARGGATRDALMLLPNGVKTPANFIRFVIDAIVGVFGGQGRRFSLLLLLLLLPPPSSAFLLLAILHLLSISRAFVFGSFGLRRLDRHALVESKAADVPLVLRLQAAFPPEHLRAAAAARGR